MLRLPRNVAHIRVHKNYIELSAKAQAFIETRPYELRKTAEGYLLVPGMVGEGSWIPRQYGRFMRFESRRWAKELGVGTTYDIVGYGACIELAKKEVAATSPA